MRAISTNIDIAAAPDKVWAILTDLAAYPDWNPFIQEASGEVAEGAKLTLRMVPAGGRAMTMQPRLLAVKEQRELRWLGHLFVPGIFDGEHGFTLTPLPGDHTRLVQSESFGGILVPLFGKVISRAENDFHALNQALKARAER